MQEEGEEVILAYRGAPGGTEQEALAQLGDGWLPSLPLDEALTSWVGSDAYWIPDQNCFIEECEQLRQMGERVLNISALTERMEHDRKYAVEIANSCGLMAPPTSEFTTTREALAFLDEHPDTAFVFKPNHSDQANLTFVPFRDEPECANRELHKYLRHLMDGLEHGFILQERKIGVEANVEVWFYNGTPFFSFVTLENKRRGDGDMGPMCGCASDVVFTVPLESKIVERTVGRMFSFYEGQRYTGFADANVIIGDGEVWFLEVCNRFGYNAHPTLFLGLAMDKFGLMMADWCDGNPEIKRMYERFRPGFAVSITCFHSKPRFGLPFYVKPRWEHQCYPFDGCKVEDDLLITGYSKEICIFVDHDYTIEQAAENCLSKLLFQEGVSFPDMEFRTDLGRTDYHGSVIRRYSALSSMGLL